jgi:enoyl-CoA hydratase
MLTIDRRNGITVVRWEHGPVNALDLELLRAVTDAVRESSGPLVLTGAGRSFSAGVDLRRIVEEETGGTAALLAALSDAFLAVFDHPAPTVAAVNGHAIAGGCVLATACDLRLMSGGTIGMTEQLVGVPFPIAVLEIVRFAIGPVASRLMLTGRVAGLPEALRIGLVDEVVEPDALLDEAVDRAAALAGIPPSVYALTKEQLHRPARLRIHEMRPADDPRVADAWTTPHASAAIADYLDRLAERGRR